jgi:DnaK suppressor protein
MDPSAARRRLQKRCKELLKRDDLNVQSRKVVELDQSRVGRLSRMDALQSQEMSLATDRRRQAEIRRIEAALERLECGEFGYCTACGEEISMSRLELDPAAPTCIDCASQT